MSLVCHFFEGKEVDWTLMAGTGLEQEKKGKGDDSLGCRETTHPPPPPQPALLSSEVCALPEMSPNQPSQYGPYIPAGEYLSHNPTRKESISLPYVLVVTSNDLGPGHGYIQLHSTSGPQNQPCLTPFKKSTARDCSQRAARPQPPYLGREPGLAAGVCQIFSHFRPENGQKGQIGGIELHQEILGHTQPP